MTPSLISITKKFREGGIGLFPSAYVWSLRKQVAPKVLTAERLLEALNEDGHNVGFTLQDAEFLLNQFRDLKHVTLKRETQGVYLKWGTQASRSKVPADDYYVLKEDKKNITIAVDLKNGYPSSKHIYRLSRRNLEAPIGSEG